MADTAPKNSRAGWFFLLGMLTVVTLLVVYAYTDDLPNPEAEEDSPRSPKTGQTVQQVRSPKIPDSVHLGGEYLPLDNLDAKERFDRELLSNCFQHASTMMNLKLANRYFPVIEPVLAKHGIPDDFKYLAVAESNLRNAVSTAGAKGIWQFMPATAKEYNMLVNNEVDERYDLYKSTEAACLYLKQAYKDFGSWSLAAASYNMGKGALKSALEAQGVDNYYDLHLNNETSRYVLRILALKEIMSQPAKYGYVIEPADLYPRFPDYRVVEIDEALISWAEVAKANNTTYRQIRLHNPWIMSSKLNNRLRQKFRVLIPN